MIQQPWFERSFLFQSDPGTFPSIRERLSGTSIRLIHKVQHLAQSDLTFKEDNNWSIQENIGHLVDLETLWQGRLDDILQGEPFLRETDLNNRKTFEANHNQRDLKSLLSDFSTERNRTLHSLDALSTQELVKQALHPRLKQPMRVIDLFLFVAEHDDHHLATISKIIKSIN